MDRNSVSHFAMNPTRLDMSRSTFDRSHSVKLTFNTGKLIPFYCDEVLPGDTFNVDTSKVCRMQTLITPVMDNLYLDTYFFFVPNRLVWDKWKNFMGESENAWIPKTEYSVPQVTLPDGGFSNGTVADYFGVPTKVSGSGTTLNALPFRAYALIYNEWFRDENLIDPVLIPTDSIQATGSNTNPVYGGEPFTACKYFDLFTGALPSPQKGPDVTLSLADSIPVYATNDNTPAYKTQSNMHFVNVGKLPISTMSGTNCYAPGVSTTNGNIPVGEVGTSALVGSTFQLIEGSGYALSPSNLWAVPGSQVNLATINQLRTAFQIQKLYERDARGGTRYIEVLKSHFGVTSPDARLQRPEYLGGNRVPININQVVQQSGTAEGSTAQGTVTGMSLTTDRHSDFTKSFVEHGFVIGLMCARYEHTYQQGLERFWSRKTRFDYYWPVFANLGEQAIKNREIYMQGSAADEEVFGYQEAWYDYRYKPSRVCAEMRSNDTGTLDSWHFGDNYSSLPALSASWIKEDATNVDRCLAVQSSTSDQFFADVYIKNKCTRAMPLYSIPGLIDHH